MRNSLSRQSSVIWLYKYLTNIQSKANVIYSTNHIHNLFDNVTCKGVWTYIYSCCRKVKDKRSLVVFKEYYRKNCWRRRIENGFLLVDDWFTVALFDFYNSWACKYIFVYYCIGTIFLNNWLKILICYSAHANYFTWQEFWAISEAIPDLYCDYCCF